VFLRHDLRAAGPITSLIHRFNMIVFLIRRRNATTLTLGFRIDPDGLLSPPCRDDSRPAVPIVVAAEAEVQSSG
jgi:hypothetical protein